ncbi:MAG: hypothetical protein R2741_08285 [Methanolobus sp.]
MKKTAVSLLLVSAILFAGYVNTDTQSDNIFTEELNGSDAVVGDGSEEVPLTEAQENTQNVSVSNLSVDRIRVGHSTYRFLAGQKPPNRKSWQFLQK